MPGIPSKKELVTHLEADCSLDSLSLSPFKA